MADGVMGYVGPEILAEDFTVVTDVDFSAVLAWQPAHHLIRCYK